MVSEITVTELAERLKGSNPPLLIDVRELNEWRYCRIQGAELRPMSQISDWMGELDPETEMVFHCHTGVRSLQVASYLQLNGFKNVLNLRGGIDAWSQEVDSSVPRY